MARWIWRLSEVLENARFKIKFGAFFLLIDVALNNVSNFQIQIWLIETNTTFVAFIQRLHRLLMVLQMFQTKIVNDDFLIADNLISIARWKFSLNNLRTINLHLFLSRGHLEDFKHSSLTQSSFFKSFTSCLEIFQMSIVS